MPDSLGVGRRVSSAKSELLTLRTKWAVRTSGTEGVGGGERPVDSTLQLPSSISEQRSAQRRSERLGFRAAATRAESLYTRYASVGVQELGAERKEKGTGRAIPVVGLRIRSSCERREW